MLAASTLSAADQEARKGRITGTRIVKLVNGEALSVFNDMMGYADPVKDNARMQAGRIFERPMLEWAAAEKGWKNLVVQPGTRVSARNPRFAASTDALHDNDTVVEGKFRGSDQAWKYEDGPTEPELVQVMWEAAVYDMPETSIVVCLGGNDLRVYDQPFDDELAAGLEEIANRFVKDHIDTGRPPPLDHTDAAVTYLRKRYPRDQGPMLQADEVVKNLVFELKARKADLKADEEDVARLEAQLKDIIGLASGIEGPGFKATWKATKETSKVDWEALATSLNPKADLIKKFTVTKPGARRFLLTFKEGK